jgi:hypothetical protein
MPDELPPDYRALFIEAATLLKKREFHWQGDAACDECGATWDEHPHHRAGCRVKALTEMASEEE